MRSLLDTRTPWIAALLSLIFPGLGQIYSGCILRGVLWFVSLYGVLLVFALVTQISLLPVFYTVFLLHGLFYILIVVDAYNCTKRVRGEDFNHRPWIPLYILMAVVIWLAESYYRHHRSELLGVESYRLASNSMTPILQEGDFVVVDTGESFRQNLTVGDVVVFSMPNEADVFVKRIAALPGERLQIRMGRVFRNDVFEPHLEVMNQRRKRQGSQMMPVLQVPPGEFFMLGDWRDNSKDSRARGTIPLGSITGKVTAVWFSRDVHRVGRVAKPFIIRQ